MNHKICSCNRLPNILKIIFLVSVIPVIVVYIIHGMEEFDAFTNAETETKAIKTFGEGTLFVSIGIGYIVTSVFVLFANSRIACLTILVGTVVIVILYWLRLYGIPIPGTEIVITDFSSDWMDAVTKIFQQILVIPCAMLLVLNTRNKKITSTK